jgi:hypothetical protein
MPPGMAVAANASVEIPAARDCVEAEKLSSSEAFTNANEEIRGSATWIAPKRPNRITADLVKPDTGGVPAGIAVDNVFLLVFTFG